MRKTPFLFFSLTAAAALLFTSCLDYVQSLSWQDGKYRLYTKVTLSKNLLSMTETGSGEFLRELEKGAHNTFPEPVETIPVNTETEAGLELILTINPRKASAREQQLLPKRNGEIISVPFLIGQRESTGSLSGLQGDEESYARIMLSTAKCRVLIAKTVLPSVSSAWFAGRGGQDFSIPVYDYGESFCLEIPLTVLYDSGMYNTENILLRQ